MDSFDVCCLWQAHQGGQGATTGWGRDNYKEQGSSLIISRM